MPKVKKLQILGEFPSGGNIDEIDPNKVIFPEGLTTTYAIGSVTLKNGVGTLVEPGGTLRDFFDLFVTEKNPTTTQPSVKMVVHEAGSYEVGTWVTPTYTASLNPGSYSYGPDTGVEATEWKVVSKSGQTLTGTSGTFNKVLVNDTTEFVYTATVTHTEGAIPLTNLGNEYPEGRIAAGTKTMTSRAITGYRKAFYGAWLYKWNLTSDTIRGLPQKTNSPVQAGDKLSLKLPVGALRAVIAYPATVGELISVRDINGMNAEILQSFTKQYVDVEGVDGYEAISYRVYVMDFGKPIDTENTFYVTIG